MSAFEGEEYVVLYGWEPENEGDLKLVAGETILVFEKNEHGWWNGKIERDDGTHTGYFPKNYVRVKSSANSAPKPPPRPSPKTTAEEENEDMEKLSSEFEKNKVIDNRKSLRQGPSFSLKTLTAFDELMDFGVAVELETNNANPHLSSGTYIANGNRVELKISALLWDGASSVIQEFASGPLSFTVGCGQVTKGLNTAMLRLRVNDSATITCSPSNAYGEAGNPPAVPPDSFIVYKVTVISVNTNAPTGADAEPAVGPSAVLGSGVATSRVPFLGTMDVKDKRSSRMILVNTFKETEEGQATEAANIAVDNAVHSTENPVKVPATIQEEE